MEKSSHTGARTDRSHSSHDRNFGLCQMSHQCGVRENDQSLNYKAHSFHSSPLSGSYQGLTAPITTQQLLSNWRPVLSSCKCSLAPSREAHEQREVSSNHGRPYAIAKIYEKLPRYNSQSRNPKRELTNALIYKSISTRPRHDQSTQHCSHFLL